MRKLESLKNVCLFKYCICERGDVDCPNIPQTTDWQDYKTKAENVSCSYFGDNLTIPQHQTKSRWIEPEVTQLTL